MDQQVFCKTERKNMHERRKEKEELFMDNAVILFKVENFQKSCGLRKEIM